MAGKDKYKKEWHEFADMLKTGQRPNNFDDAWALVPKHISGMYEAEMRALWDILSNESIRTMAEVGRNLGGTLFMFGCACDILQYVSSVDIAWYDVSDEALKDWFDSNEIEFDIEIINSAFVDYDDYDWPRAFDFVFIDGLHTGPAVKADIEIWKDHARLIGFHDYSDNKTNEHHRHFPDVVYEISKAARENGWEQVGERGRSEIVFKTENY